MCAQPKQVDLFRVDGYLAVILFLAFFVRLADLAVPSHYPQPDELFSLDVASEPFIGESLRRLASDTHPPLYFLILRYWLKVTSKTLFSAKVLSIIFNVANILFTYFFCQIWVDKRTARWAALFMALSPWNIYWAHLSRNHQMLPPLFT
ncbi:glycosyltransferase family 39 protein, partial [Candidatus Sumerlaeota bacterium]|nr:glycosyltransferase family 39 protein [Candidatus Sumerlaeota bacterium]